jgi:hypothetical protein
MTMEDFMKTVGTLKGSEEKHDFYAGDPAELVVAEPALVGAGKKRDSVMDDGESAKR